MRLVLLVLLLCFGTATAAFADDPFGHPAGADPAPATEPAARGPSLMGGFVQRLAREQSKINDRISHEIRTVRDTGSMAAMLTILSITFLWGVLHAAGPGHGKTLVAAYFATTEARWTSGIIMGGVISLLQGLTAIIVVFILAAVLHQLQQEVRLSGAVIEPVSRTVRISCEIWSLILLCSRARRWTKPPISEGPLCAGSAAGGGWAPAGWPNGSSAKAAVAVPKHSSRTSRMRRIRRRIRDRCS